jgi:hypothetical protein
MGNARRSFARDIGTVEPAFVPGKDYEHYPLGSAEAQATEAMRTAKEGNKKLALLEESTGMSERIMKMDNLTVPRAVEFLDSLSQTEREKYLNAEKLSRKRSTILASYGWE